MIILFKFFSSLLRHCRLPNDVPRSDFQHKNWHLVHVSPPWPSGDLPQRNDNARKDACCVDQWWLLLGMARQCVPHWFAGEHHCTGCQVRIYSMVVWGSFDTTRQNFIALFCVQHLYSTFPKSDLLRQQLTVSPSTQLRMLSTKRRSFKTILEVTQLAIAWVINHL